MLPLPQLLYIISSENDRPKRLTQCGSAFSYIYLSDSVFVEGTGRAGEAKEGSELIVSGRP